MLNYNRSFRENSTSKSRSRSIYTGNKSHAVSMNLKISQEVYQDAFQQPLRDIKNEDLYRLENCCRDQQRPKSTLKLKNRQSKFQETPVSMSKNMQRTQNRCKLQESMKCSQTERYSRQSANFKRGKDYSRLKTEVMDQKAFQNKQYKAPSAEYIQLSVQELTEFLKKLYNMQKTKERMSKEIAFYKRQMADANSLVLKALGC